MGRGGARPNSGGKRPGAGRKATRPPVKRRVMLELSSEEAAMLAALEAATACKAASVLRGALRELHLRCLGAQKGG